MAKRPIKQKPFVIDMRHEEDSDPSYDVAWTWEKAIEIAAEFWRMYEGSFDPLNFPKQPFRAGEGYAQADVDVIEHRKGKTLFLKFAKGSGPCIRIEKSQSALRCPLTENRFSVSPQP